MADFLAEFQDKMQKDGFTPKGGKVICDDKWHQASHLSDSKGYYSGTYTMKIVDGDFAIGCYFTRKEPDTKYKWHSRSKDKLTPEERKRINREIEQNKKLKEKSEEKRYERISARLSRVVEKMPLAEQHAYATRKGIGLHGARFRNKGGELILPLCDARGRIWTIQRITADGRKYLFTGGKKRGNFYSLSGVLTSAIKRVFITEGYSTGASVLEASGVFTIAAIDSGNIRPVLEALVKAFPATRFIIAADNDAFTVNAKKEPWNVGVERANEAAASVSGCTVFTPVFDGVEPDIYKAQKLTDYNDLHRTLGLDALAAQLQEKLNKIPAPSAQEQTAVMEIEPDHQHHDGGDYSMDAPPPEDIANYKDFGMNYRVLGYNEGMYYYFPYTERQIVALSASGHTLPNLFRLDNLDNWTGKFGGAEVSDKNIVKYATAALMSMAQQRGIFKEDDRVRGCGAWLDDGRKVLHCGDKLYVDGQPMRLDEFKSDFTYVAASKLMRPASDALKNSEAYMLRKICEAVTWENKLSGSLLAGWLVIAPICAALDFRPHVYITGESDSGKSTVMDKIIKPVLGRMSLNVDGGTTEPKVRELMSYDARPIVYDEAEPSESMIEVIKLARKSSSGATVGKFGQRMVKARFCFCFSAINPPVKEVADESRISFMVIKKNKRPTAIAEYEALLAQIEKHLTPDFSNRLMKRTLDNLDVLLKNIDTFSRAARIVIGSARPSKMIGAMLGGLYLLNSTEEVTLEFAQGWIKERDFSDHALINAETDPVRLLQFICGCVLKYSSSQELSIGDLILAAYKNNDSTADKLLRYNGIAVKDKRVYFAGTSTQMERLLRETDWKFKWTSMLENLPGADKFKSFYFGVAKKTSGVSLPIDIFTDEGTGQQTDFSFQEVEF